MVLLELWPIWRFGDTEVTLLLSAGVGFGNVHICGFVIVGMIVLEDSG